MTLKPSKGITLVLGISVPAITMRGCAEDRALRKRQAQAKQDLGRSLLAQGNYTAGLGELREAATIDPENPEIQNELALAYREMERYPKAITHFNRAVELNPDFSEAYNNLGTVYLILKKWDPAISYSLCAKLNVPTLAAQNQRETLRLDTQNIYPPGARRL